MNIMRPSRIGNPRFSACEKPPHPKKKISQSTLPPSSMPDEKQSDDNKQQETSGRPLTEEEWIELMNKHDRLSQYAKERREKSDDE